MVEDEEMPMVLMTPADNTSAIDSLTMITVHGCPTTPAFGTENDSKRSTERLLRGRIPVRGPGGDATEAYCTSLAQEQDE